MSAPPSARPPDAPSSEAFYGFAQPPFTLAPDPRFLYLSTSHDDAIRQILQSIRRKEGFVVLTGDIGTGKTTLSRALLQQLDPHTFTSLILNPFLSVEELLREVLLDFGIVSRDAVRRGVLAQASKHELISTLHEFLLSLVPIKGSGVLIIDEAQHLSPAVLEQIRVISNLETNSAKLLQIVLVGQLNLLDTLTAADMRQLDQRISLRATLAPLTLRDVEAYVAHRLSVAEGTAPVSFEPAALGRLSALSGGVPRTINLLCDRALMDAAATGVHTITPTIVDRAAAQLNLTPPAVAPTEDTAVPDARPRRRWLPLAATIAVIAGFVTLLFFVVPLANFIDVRMPAFPSAPTPRLGPSLTPRPPTPQELAAPPLAPPPPRRFVPPPAPEQ